MRLNLCMLSPIKKRSPESFLHELLPKLLAKNAPSKIPMSGDAARSNDFYTIYLGEEYYVQSYDPDTRVLGVLGLDSDNNFSVSAQLNLRDAIQWPIRITHYFKSYWRDYKSLHHLARHYKFYWFQITVYANIYVKRILQWIFNKKRLWVVRDRTDLLDFIIQWHIRPKSDADSFYSSSISKSFTTYSLMNELLSTKWVHHPHSIETKRRLELFLDAFVESGDLEKKDFSYTLAPRATLTLSQHQENERRHRDAMRTQWIIILLTFILAFSSAVEVYDLIKQ